MDAYNWGRLLGMSIGLVIGLVIAGVIMVIINKNHRFRTEYDEMQKIIRGDGYRIAFYTVMIIEGVLCFVTTATELPMEPIVIHFFAIFAGVMVQAGYCIWKGAYVGLNTRMNRFIIIMTLVSLFNLFIAFMAWREGELTAGGKLQAPFVNFLCGLMFAILGIVGLARKIADREVGE